MHLLFICIGVSLKCKLRNKEKAGQIYIDMRKGSSSRLNPGILNPLRGFTPRVTGINQYLSTISSSHLTCSFILKLYKNYKDI